MSMIVIACKADKKEKISRLIEWKKGMGTS